MYTLPYFIENDPARVLQFVREHPFAFITGCDKDLRPAVTQVPLFIDEKENGLFLSGHLMKNTDHHRAFQQNPQVLAVFSGPHTYVSASWYADKRQASTWNYMSVHARGHIKFLEEAALLAVLKRTTDHFENNPASGANFDDLPPDYVQRLARAIVAFEIEVEKLENVFKLSQNRDEASYDNIILRLGQQDESGRFIAGEMEKRRSRLFQPEAQRDDRL